MMMLAPQLGRLPIDRHSCTAEQTRRPAVFPAPKNPTVACDRHLLDSLLRRAATLGKVKLEKGGLWHSLRRKWATERKGYPVKDVAAAGGWRDAETMLTSYQQVDAKTIKQVVLHPT